VVGFYPVVAVAGWVALLAWHRRRPGNLPGAQPAAGSRCCWISLSPVAPPAEPLVGLRLPGEESDPTSRRTIALRSNPAPTPWPRRCGIPPWTRQILDRG